MSGPEKYQGPWATWRDFLVPTLSVVASAGIVLVLYLAGWL